MAKEVQNRLLELSQSGRVGTEDGDAWLVKEVSLLLQRNSDSIKSVATEKFENIPLSEAEQKFEDLANQERAKYGIEGVRADEHGVMTDSTKSDANMTEVSEYIVVTIIVAVSETGMFVQIKGAIETPVSQMLSTVARVTPDNLLAMEVIWQPYSPDDGVLTAEDLDQKYPDLIGV